MSYYLTCDRSRTFTPGQYERMRNGLQLRLNPTNAYSLTSHAPTAVYPVDVSVSMAATGAVIRFSYPYASVAGFLIERSSEPEANFTAIGSLPPHSFSFVDGLVTPNTTYYYRVKASNATTQYSQVASINTGRFYCIPGYTWSGEGSTAKIDDFILTGIRSTLRSVASGRNKTGYADFTTLSHAVLAGHPYSFTASAATNATGSFAPQHLTIWIDSNQDGIFSESEILFQSSAQQLMNPTIRGTIRLPTSAPGSYRLRVRSQFVDDGLVQNPCSTYTLGEAEDYLLQVEEAPVSNCFSLSATVALPRCPISQDGSVQVLTKGGTAPFSYSLNSQANSTGLFSGLSAGLYTAIVSDANACRDTLAIVVSAPVEATASLTGASTICPGDVVSLSVLISDGSGPYELQLSDGVSLSTISGYSSGSTLPVYPAYTTTYQLHSLTNSIGCPVQVATATATVLVHSGSLASVLPQNVTVCYGQPLALTASGGSQYQWQTGQTGNILTVTESGTYSVTVTDQQGCRRTANSSVWVTNCPQPVWFRAKVLLEGFADPQTGQMHGLLVSKSLLPKQQPFSGSPWFYMGTEQLITVPADVTDWVLVMARNASGDVLARRAALLRTDGTIISPDRTEGVWFPAVSEPVYASIHHRSHLAILTDKAIDAGTLVDFTTDKAAARGAIPLNQLGQWFAMFSGDYDANGVINSSDFNRWKVSASAIGKYLPIDGDGNGIVNNKDFNRWMLNRSKIGIPGL
ncbi:hypothetical protein GGR92_003284 [Spirosoma lacussanchae]|uniref:GEVED domain-containing protein n=1 Tax=Spirosoma lacussanchae TaxID=1884249 RepID=UPI0011081E21|nr:GEVED domain-containing protein [Spirosoma lacussanchae]